MRILIAEDDLTSRAVLRAVLQKHGHDVVETRDGVEAWEVLQSANAPPLLVLDWMMPGIDGTELCRRTRQLPLDRPPYIIMLTALADKAHVAGGLRAGADDYIAKPFDVDELCARIEVGRRVLDLQARLAAEATTDSLMGLPNRRAGLDVLQRELYRASREGQCIGVAVVDVDHFKRVNDTYGHQVGDDVLREIGQRLRSTLRPYDHLCRYGGEEFLLIAPGSRPEKGPWERLHTAVAKQPLSTRAGEILVTVSLGFTSGNASHTGDELIAAADRALYRAKNLGRNRVEREDIPLGRIAVQASVPPLARLSLRAAPSLRPNAQPHAEETVHNSQASSEGQTLARQLEQEMQTLGAAGLSVNCAAGLHGRMEMCIDHLAVDDLSLLHKALRLHFPED